jgi:6-phosphogluconolactonase
VSGALAGAAGSPRLERFPDAAALARAAAAEVARRAAEAVAARGRFTLSLAGGSTPRALYQLLADPDGPFRARIAWPAVLVLFGDERAVPPDDPLSNYRMAREALLDQVPVGGVVRMEGELGAAAAAERCEAELRRLLGAVPVPSIDLVLLGLGTDGHTASLFPGSPALEERRRWVVAAPGPAPATGRITFTPPLLEAARALLFLVAGADKAGALRQLLRPHPGEPAIPAARLRPRGAQLVLADEPALAQLGERPVRK